ncbi:hypothetical protein LTR08_004627 [Meristemomyces frigidus]|nr:hypothetical protein LTR08_004627 [Meristemomyces frigidus]
MATPAGGEEIPSHRACAYCRAQKVRCIVTDANPDVCQRCARIGRPCVFTALQKRKQRKRTDTRVAELELEMRNMRSMLKTKQEGLTALGEARTLSWSQGRSEGVSERRLQPEPSTSSGACEQMTSHYTLPRRPSDLALRLQALSATPPDQSGSDVVARGMLSMATARQLVETYRRDMFPQNPVVALRASTSADELRQEKPALFLAILAAASTKLDPELSAALDAEVLQAYAKRVLVQSEKSPELVQSLLISAQWYHPPSKCAHLKYYDFIRMAVTMATEIGMSTRQGRYRPGRPGKAKEDNRDRVSAYEHSSAHPAEDPQYFDRSMTPRSRDSSPDTGSIECRRAFVGCYIICAAVSTSLRRPNILRVSTYVRECVDFLQQSPDAIPTDCTLVAWAKLIMIADEITASLSHDDLGGLAHISELRTQLMLKDFARRLTAWFTSVPQTDMTGSLTIIYYGIRLYLHEIVLYGDHSPEDFKAPYQMGPLQLSSDEDDNVPTEVLADAIMECITCIHALLDTFLAMEVDGLRALPVVSYVRVSYAAFVLAKLCLSASHPPSRIGNLLSSSSLDAERYIDRLVLHLRDIIGPYKCRVPFIILALVFKVRQCCMEPLMIESSPQDQSVLTLERPPLAAIGEPFQGPRFTEQSSSSSDDSPQTAAGLQAAYEDVNIMGAQETAAYSAPFGTLPTSLSAQHGYSEQPKGAGFGLPAGEDGLSQGLPFISAPDQMQLDSDFMASFGDMSAFAQGGGTGFDDWVPNGPANLGQMPEMINWYASFSNGGSE